MRSANNLERERESNNTVFFKKLRKNYKLMRKGGKDFEKYW
jgi:hypothetical protein